MTAHFITIYDETLTDVAKKIDFLTKRFQDAIAGQPSIVPNKDMSEISSKNVFSCTLEFGKGFGIIAADEISESMRRVLAVNKMPLSRCLDNTRMSHNVLAVKFFHVDLGC